MHAHPIQISLFTSFFLFREDRASDPSGNSYEPGELIVLVNRSYNTISPRAAGDADKLLSEITEGGLGGTKEKETQGDAIIVYHKSFLHH